MKHLVLYYDKYKTFSPKTQTFESAEELEKFVSAKVKGGVDCFTYIFAEKYSQQQTITSTKTI